MVWDAFADQGWLSSPKNQDAESFKVEGLEGATIERVAPWRPWERVRRIAAHALDRRMSMEMSDLATRIRRIHDVGTKPH